jgi:hypothetical protein
VPDLRIQPAIDNGDLDPKQLELDFNNKELEPITFGNQSINFNEWLSFIKSNRLLEGHKNDK